MTDKQLYPDVNTHEFTLEALAELYNIANKNKYDIRKTRKFNTWLAFKINVALAVGYNVIAGLNYRIKRLEQKERKVEENTTE